MDTKADTPCLRFWRSPSLHRMGFHTEGIVLRTLLLPSVRRDFLCEREKGVPMKSGWGVSFAR
jgi:hypothetical protein